MHIWKNKRDLLTKIIDIAQDKEVRLKNSHHYLSLYNCGKFLSDTEAIRFSKFLENIDYARIVVGNFDSFVSNHTPYYAKFKYKMRDNKSTPFYIDEDIVCTVNDTWIKFSELL